MFAFIGSAGRSTGFGLGPGFTVVEEMASWVSALEIGDPWRAPACFLFRCFCNLITRHPQIGQGREGFARRLPHPPLMLSFCRPMLAGRPFPAFPVSRP